MTTKSPKKDHKVLQNHEQKGKMSQGPPYGMTKILPFKARPEVQLDVAHSPNQTQSDAKRPNGKLSHK